jgi:hypothetical protein
MSNIKDDQWKEASETVASQVTDLLESKSEEMRGAANRSELKTVDVVIKVRVDCRGKSYEVRTGITAAPLVTKVRDKRSKTGEDPDQVPLAFPEESDAPPNPDPEVAAQQVQPTGKTKRGRPAGSRNKEK